MLGQLADELVTTLSDSGVGAGHAVIITAPNSVETAATVLAIWALKAVPVFMSPNAPHTHLDHAIEICDAAAIVTANGLELCHDPQSTMPDGVGSVGTKPF